MLFGSRAFQPTERKGHKTLHRMPSGLKCSQDWFAALLFLFRVQQNIPHCDVTSAHLIRRKEDEEVPEAVKVREVQGRPHIAGQSVQQPGSNSHTPRDQAPDTQPVRSVRGGSAQERQKQQLRVKVLCFDQKALVWWRTFVECTFWSGRAPVSTTHCRTWVLQHFEQSQPGNGKALFLVGSTNSCSQK